MNEYELEPWMPTPIAPTSAPGKQFSMPRPYIPHGTGYNALRSRPGVAELKKQLSGVGRTEYTPATSKGSTIASKYNVVKLPKDYLNLNANSGPLGSNHAKRVLENNFKHNLDKKFHLSHKSKIGIEQYIPRAKDFGTMRGLYSPGTHSIIYPKNDPGNTKRHELQHAVQQHRMTGNKTSNTYRGPSWEVPLESRFEPGKTMSTHAKELEANIVQNKSIRKGYEKFADGQKFYDTPEKDKNKVRRASKIINMIPGKPGMMTGRLPTPRGMLGFGAGMLNFGPLQKAKSDPTYGMGEEERRNLEHAYQYGL